MDRERSRIQFPTLSNSSCLSHFLIEEIWTAGTALSCSTTWSLFKSNVKSVNSFTLLCDSYSATYFMSFTSNTQPSSLEWKLEEKGFWPQISTNLTKTGHLHFIVWLHPLGYSNQPWGPYIGSKLLRLRIPHEACELKTTTTRTTTTATATTRATASTTAIITTSASRVHQSADICRYVTIKHQPLGILPSTSINHKPTCGIFPKFFRVL